MREPSEGAAAADGEGATSINQAVEHPAVGLPERKALVDAIKENLKRRRPSTEGQGNGDKVQFSQEIGGLYGRNCARGADDMAISRVALLKIFQVPGLVLLPVTYFILYQQGGTAFAVGHGPLRVCHCRAVQLFRRVPAESVSRCICVAPGRVSRPTSAGE